MSEHMYVEFQSKKGDRHVCICPKSLAYVFMKPWDIECHTVRKNILLYCNKVVL